MVARLTPEQRADRDLTENALKAEVLKLAAKHGWKVFTLSQVNIKRPQRNSSGYPDLTLARNGVVLWIELKREDTLLDDAQEAWRRVLPEGFYAVARPSDLRNGTVARWLR